MDRQLFDVMVEGTHGSQGFLKTVRVCATSAAEAGDLAFSAALKAGLMPSRIEGITEGGPAGANDAIGLVRGFGTSFFEKG
jgi:hypothetical protein